MFNYYVRYLTRINPAYFKFIMQYKKLCYYNCKVFSILKTNGNLNFVFIVNCKKDHDSLKEINENLIKDLKIHQGNNVHLGTVDLKLSNIQIISI